MDKNWIGDLKPGDKVIVAGNYDKWISTVNKITKTQVVVNGSNENYVLRFRKDGGEVGGDIWRRKYLLEATDEEVAIISEETRRRILRHKISGFSFSRLLTPGLEDINRIINGCEKRIANDNPAT